MENQQIEYGIQGQSAPELSKEIRWIDAEGAPMAPIQLKDYPNQFKVIYGFQAWCPGCHSHGLPSLQRLVGAFKEEENIKFFAVQTVFEGAHINTAKRLREIQEKYNLAIPFGHDPGNQTTGHRSSIMHYYRTGGTPWFIFIDKAGKVVFNDFHVDTFKAIEYLKSVL